MSKAINDTILVSVDFTQGDVGVLVVGRKRPNESVEIINALQGDEAWELYEKLITPIKISKMEFTKIKIEFAKITSHSMKGDDLQ